MSFLREPTAVNVASPGQILQQLILFWKAIIAMQDSTGSGSVAITVGSPGADGEDGEAGSPGLPGVAGVAGATGAQGPQGPPGLAPDPDDPDAPMMIPGVQGVQGVSGATGAQGFQGPPGIDADEPEAPFLVPGAQGPRGFVGAQGPPPSDPDEPDSPMAIPGIQGQQGPQGVSAPTMHGWDGIDGEDAPIIPGPRGPAPAYTAFTQDLGAARLSGTFDITGLAGLVTGQYVDIRQTPAAIASRGNATDEPEMDAINLSGTVLNATTIRAYWACTSIVVGIYAFAYYVSG